MKKRMALLTIRGLIFREGFLGEKNPLKGGELGPEKQNQKSGGQERRENDAYGEHDHPLRPLKNSNTAIPDQVFRPGLRVTRDESPENNSQHDEEPSEPALASKKKGDASKEKKIRVAVDRRIKKNTKFLKF